MIRILAHPVFARLFAAQAIALIGTGLMTVALGLLAYDLAGDAAGAVLGTALAIKMVAYVGLAPVASALAHRMPRKAVLIGADLIRAAAALALPFITQIWQIYALIFLLQAASATFSPAFQATIPDILEDEDDYTRALSLTRLAYDIENLVSPALAGLLLLVMGYHWLFAGTTFGFLASALLVWSATIPKAPDTAPRPFRERLTRGMRLYLATPRLRGLLALTMAAASGSAFVLVNTVVLVKSGYGIGGNGLAMALAAYGGGSMLAALALPPLLDRLPDRGVMTLSALALSALTLATGALMATSGLPPWPAFLALWALLGLFYSATLTPSGRLLRRSSHPEDRPALFAAQFALSHACWLVTYPAAGWIGDAWGLPAAMLTLGALALAACLAAFRLWPAGDPQEIAHDHPDLPADHPHLATHGGTNRHIHPLIIDDEHPGWPADP